MGNHCMKDMTPRSCSPSIVEMLQAREEGQALLRSLVLKSTDVDWEAVIRAADQLVAQEQAWLKKRKRKERKNFQKQVLKTRRKYDATGSFSVNLLTYRPEGDSHEDDDDDLFIKSYQPERYQFERIILDDNDAKEFPGSCQTISTSSSYAMDDHSSYDSTQWTKVSDSDQMSSILDESRIEI